jgi:NitT/TauT family transport system permease protein
MSLAMPAAALASAQGSAMERSRARRSDGRLRLVRNRLLAIALLLLAWEAAGGGFGERFAFVNTIVVAPPSLALRELIDYALSGLLLTDIQSTFSAAFLGLALGFAGGAVMGIIFGYWKAFAETFEPIVFALNSLPRVAIAPLLLMWLGLGLASKVAVSFFSVFFVVFFNAYMGTRAVDPDLVRAVTAIGATKFQVTRMVVMPSVASWIFAAMRTAISYALTSTITAEFVGSTAGLGYRLQVAAGLLDTKRVFAILLVLMVLGGLLLEINKLVENRVLRWRPKSQLQS